MTSSYESWDSFKDVWAGFGNSGYDDTYHFIFRYDIHKEKEDMYALELCVMLQRKGIYAHIWIKNITQNELNSEIFEFLKERKKYMNNLWDL